MGQPQHHAGAAPMPPAGEAEDTEWEYEYDADETEDLYFTLDLTTHVPDALVRKYDTAPDNHAGTKAVQKSRNGDVQGADGDGDATIDEPPPNRAAAGTRPRTTLQVLDLHTRNPLVKFDNNVYSCYWSTDLGTQFHISQAGVTPNPRRAGTVLDVVGTSQTRLIGKPITLTQKDFGTDEVEPTAAVPSESEDLAAQSGDANVVETAPGSSKSATQPLVIPRELCKNRAAEAQASFLERLSQIKLKKGETDPLPIFSIKYYREPDNKDELKKRAKAADAAKRKVDDEAAVGLGGSTKRRKRLTAAEKGTVPDNDAPTGGRQGREAIGARVGFQGQAPGALSTKRKYVLSGKYAKGKRVATPNLQSENDNGDSVPEGAAESGDPPTSAADAGIQASSVVSPDAEAEVVDSPPD